MRQKSAGDKCLQEEGRFNTAAIFVRDVTDATGSGGTFLSDPRLLLLETSARSESMLACAPLERVPRPLPLRVATTPVAV